MMPDSHDFAAIPQDVEEFPLIFVVEDFWTCDAGFRKKFKSYFKILSEEAFLLFLPSPLRLQLNASDRFLCKV